MTGPTHVLIALAGAAATGHLTGSVPSGGAIIFIILGALAPDLDGGGSITRPGRIFQSLLGHRLAKLIDVLIQVISGVVQVIFGHRGFIHSPFLGLLFMAGGWLAGLPMLFWFGWGYIWHLAGDFLTPAGIPLLAPISLKRFHGANIVTGSMTEKLLSILLLVVTVLLGWPLLPEGVREAHLNLIELLSRKR